MPNQYTSSVSTAEVVEACEALIRREQPQHRYVAEAWVKEIADGVGPGISRGRARYQLDRALQRLYPGLPDRPRAQAPEKGVHTPMPISERRRNPSGGMTVQLTRPTVEFLIKAAEATGQQDMNRLIRQALQSVIREGSCCAAVPAAAGS